MFVQPYLFFDGRCEEALEFYKAKLGAQVEMLMRWKDSPDKSMCNESNENKVMHCCFKVGDTAVMGSDGRNTGHPDFKGFALSITAKDEAEADKVFGALGEGGQVQMPMAKTFFSPRFGMVADKFGVGWMVMRRAIGASTTRSDWTIETGKTGSRQCRSSSITTRSRLSATRRSSPCMKTISRSSRSSSISATRNRVPLSVRSGRSQNSRSCATKRGNARSPRRRSSSNISTRSIPAPAKFVPADPELAWQTRMWDRFYDLYVHLQMQKITGDRLRPAGARDPFGVEQAKAALLRSYAMIDQAMDGKTCAMGDTYSLVDCAASPALFYASIAAPFDGARRNLAAYFNRLMSRPSYGRALKEAEPYFDLFPMETKPQLPKEIA